MLEKNELKRIDNLLDINFFKLDKNKLPFKEDVANFIDNLKNIEQEIVALKLIINGLKALLLPHIMLDKDFLKFKNIVAKDDPDFVLFGIEKRKESVDEKLFFLENILEKKTILNNQSNSNQEDCLIPDLEKLQNRTKIILLQELGVLDFLKKKEAFKNSTALAKVVAELVTGKNEEVSSVYNSIRTDLSYVCQKKHPKTPYKTPQINKVNAILSYFSLPLIK